MSVISPPAPAPAPPSLTTAIGQSKKSSAISYPPTTAKYEEVVQTPDLFWASLKSFNEAIGVRLKRSSRHFLKEKSLHCVFVITDSVFIMDYEIFMRPARPPTVAGGTLDLHRLFVEVTSRGGIQKLIRDRLWKEVIAAFDFGSKATSGSFVVRKIYLEQLYDFEQACYLGKKTRPNKALDSINGSASAGAPELGDSSTQDGSLVTGVIDGKFDGGYLVTVRMGSELIKGVLYHSNPARSAPEGSVTMIPAAATPKRRRRRSRLTPGAPEGSMAMNSAAAGPKRRRKRSRLVPTDPSRPKSNRNGYNFFFAEHYIRLKSGYQGREKEIGRAIGQLWNDLTFEQKQVYQERGTQDKERYHAELEEYRATIESLQSAAHGM
ncbi:hypothetical protein ACFE04_025161 [Oxalis oulophora]